MERHRDDDRHDNVKNRDMNRDPITKEPGSHPVGTGIGSAGGAAAGAAIGALGGPIGMLIGGAIGAVAGGAAGHAAGEAIDPTGEVEYWRTEHTRRPYYDKSYAFDSDYEPAYRYGIDARNRNRNRPWDNTLENDLKTNWQTTRGKSRLEWDTAKPAVRDAWDRSDRTYRAYDSTDNYWKTQHTSADYFDRNLTFDDYRPAYRYGTFARSRYGDRAWDTSLENDLSRDWDRHKGSSRLTWDKAKLAVRDAWHGVERAIPGDFDKDGR
jgi:uncharacterized protein YcfJ